MQIGGRMHAHIHADAREEALTLAIEKIGSGGLAGSREEQVLREAAVASKSRDTLDLSQGQTREGVSIAAYHYSKLPSHFAADEWAAHDRMDAHSKVPGQNGAEGSVQWEVAERKWTQNGVQWDIAEQDGVVPPREIVAMQPDSNAVSSASGHAMAVLQMDESWARHACSDDVLDAEVVDALVDGLVKQVHEQPNSLHDRFTSFARAGTPQPWWYQDERPTELEALRELQLISASQHKICGDRVDNPGRQWSQQFDRKLPSEVREMLRAEEVNEPIVRSDNLVDDFASVSRSSAPGAFLWV